MVYITPLPNGTTRQQARAPSSDDQQTDQQQKAPLAQTRHAASSKLPAPQQQRRRPAGAGKAVAPKLKQRAVDLPGDPQQLLAYQAALATQALQREHAVQLQCSTANLQQQPSSTQHVQQQAGQPAARGVQAVQPFAVELVPTVLQQPPQACGSASGQAPRPAEAPGLPLQQLQQQHLGHPLPLEQQQRMQEVLHPGQVVHAKRSQNHMFWDVAARTIKSAEVPGLTESFADAALAAVAELPPAWQQQQQQHTRSQGQAQGRMLPTQKRQAAQTGQGRQQPAVTGPPQGGVSATPAADDHYAFDPAASAYGEMQSLQVQYSQQAHYAQGPAVSDALAVGAGSASVCSVQQQPVLTHAEQAAEVTEALKAAQQHPGPLARQRMVKDLKQQLYKLELEQQIAEQEAAKRARKAAAVAQEAADAAARAAVPAPWDPAARASRRGGGGEPLKGVDGAPVADLRNQRHMLPVPGLDVCASQVLGSAAGSPTHQPAPQQQQQHAFAAAGGSSSPGAGGAHATLLRTQRCTTQSSTAAGSTSAVSTPADAGAGVARGCFLRSLSELRPGPSQQQRAAAAAARQQLQRDLQAQMAEKAARAAAQAAAEVARAAAEEASLQQYLLAKSSSQADVCAVGKEASIVYAAAGPLNMPAAPAAAAAAAVPSSHGVPAVQRKGRSKRVIDAPWLDQLKPSQPSCTPEEQHLQLQQELSQLHLQSHHVQPQQHMQHAAADSSSRHVAPTGGYGQAGGNRDVLLTARQGLWKETSSFKIGASALAVDDNTPSSGHATVPALSPVNSSLSNAQLATALQQVQQLQQDQLRMWDDFKQQAQELQQLLTDKQAVAADRDAARAELGRVQELLQQQKALQEAYASQQQALLNLQQQQQHHYSTLHVSPRALQQELPGSHGDVELQDAFVVETQLVPISVNRISADTAALSDLPGLRSSEGAGELQGPPSQPPAAAAAEAPVAGRKNKSRYSSFYGLDSELSAASVASQAANNSSKAAARKVRTRVSGGYKPGLMASAAAAAEADAAAHAGASVGSSLAASTSFVPFMHLGMQQLGLAQQRGEADDVQGRPGKGLSPRRHQQQDTGAAGAAAGSGAAVGRPAWHKHADGSSLGRQCKQGSGSPNAARGQHSPSRAKQHAGADRGWARRATLPQRRQTKRC